MNCILDDSIIKTSVYGDGKCFDWILCQPKIPVDALSSEIFKMSERELYDEIINSQLSSWILSSEVFPNLFKAAKQKVIEANDAFIPSDIMYLQWKANAVDDAFTMKMLKLNGVKTSSINSPHNSLKCGNERKESDMDVLLGRKSLRNCLLESIKKFLETKDKSHSDFTCSLLVNEILNPVFISRLSEAELIVAISIFGNELKNRKLFPASSISDAYIYMLTSYIWKSDRFSVRIKKMLWKSLFNNDRTRNLDILFDQSVAASRLEKEWECINRKIPMSDIFGIVAKADGDYYSMEMDCTLRGLDADKLFWYPIHLQDWSVLDGLIDFADKERQIEIFKEMSDGIKYYDGSKMVNTLNKSLLFKDM